MTPEQHQDCYELDAQERQRERDGEAEHRALCAAGLHAKRSHEEQGKISVWCKVCGARFAVDL